MPSARSTNIRLPGRGPAGVPRYQPRRTVDYLPVQALYLRQPASGYPNIPDGSTSASLVYPTPDGNPARALKQMSISPGSAFTTLNANLSGAAGPKYGIAQQWVSPPLQAAPGIPFGRWSVLSAFALGVAATSTWKTGGMVLYLWRPSTQTVVARIVDDPKANTAVNPTVTDATRRALRVAGNSAVGGVNAAYYETPSSLLSTPILSGDVLVLEHWVTIIAGGSSPNQNIGFAGTEPSDPQNLASALFVPTALQFTTGPIVSPVTFAGTSTFVTTVIPYRKITAAFAGTSSLTATVKAYRRVSVTFAGTSSLTATVKPYNKIAVTFAGTSALTAAVKPYRKLTPTFAGTSAFTASVVALRKVTVTFAGTSSLTGTVKPYRNIAPAFAGTSTFAATVTPYRRIAASFAGTSSFTSTVTPYRRISTTFAGTSTFGGTVRRYNKITVTLGGTSTFGGTVTGYRRITVTLGGTSTLTGAIIAYRRLIVGFTGTGRFTASLGPPPPPTPARAVGGGGLPPQWVEELSGDEERRRREEEEEAVGALLAMGLLE